MLPRYSIYGSEESGMDVRTLKPRRGFVALAFLLVVGTCAALVGQAPPDRCLVPASIRDAILNEYSGEQAYLHVQLLSANRDRQADEYQNAYFETTYLADTAKRYGLSDVQVDLFPGGEVWDAEEADLWLIEPVTKKIASLNQVPTSLASGSTSADVETEVVYVGAGRDADYQGKDVTGKIVLANAGLGRGMFNGALTRGAVGALGTGSAGVSANSAGYTLDQLGWSSVSVPSGRQGFGFVLSLRQMMELQSYVEAGKKIVMRAHVRARRYPGKMNVVSASIPGSDPNAGDLLYVAHAFETISTPGANDNCSGVGTTLEIARTLARLIRDGTLPQPRRTLRFLWVPEISGSRAWMFKHPELEDRLLAVLNFDMPGSDLKKTDTYLRMKMTPDSVPSFLNDLIANLLLFVDQTEIRTQTGNNGPFNYRIVPFIAASDHAVFLAAGIPAMQFNHWPDNFYHSSSDTIVQNDPTETKRIGFVGASALYYLANAGAPEARALAWESAANGEKWMSEVARQSIRLLGQDGAKLAERHAAAQNKVIGAFNRARGGVQSSLKIARDKDVDSTVQSLLAGIDAVRSIESRKLEAVYRDRAISLGVQPSAPVMSARAQELGTMIPRKRFKAFSEEMRSRSSERGGRGGEPTVGPPGAPPSGGAPTGAAQPGGGRAGSGLPSLASGEVSAFIDGTRSVLDIYNAVRAEYGNVTTSSNDFKFAYVVGAEYPDIDMEAVASAIQALERSGVVEITKVVPPVPAKGRKK
jgi:aminopeptidase YwaD